MVEYQIPELMVLDDWRRHSYAGVNLEHHECSVSAKSASAAALLVVLARSEPNAVGGKVLVQDPLRGGAKNDQPPSFAVTSQA